MNARFLNSIASLFKNFFSNSNENTIYVIGGKKFKTLEAKIYQRKTLGCFKNAFSVCNTNNQINFRKKPSRSEFNQLEWKWPVPPLLGFLWNWSKLKTQSREGRQRAKTLIREEHEWAPIENLISGALVSKIAKIPLVWNKSGAFLRRLPNLVRLLLLL